MCVCVWEFGGGGCNGCMGAGRDEGAVSTVSLNASVSLSNPDIILLLSAD